MSITYGFYNSQNGDRKYNAEQMGSIFDGIIQDGVYQTIGDRFVVSPNDGTIVLVGSGRAWFNHTWTLNDASVPIDCGVSEVLLNRYDAIVLEINASDTVRANSIKVVKGTPSSSPSYPTLTNTETVHQYPLAYIYRKAGSTEITAANITSMIGTSSCPYVIGVLEVLEADDVYASWEAKFNQWFADMTQEGNTEFDTWLTQTQLEFNTWYGNLQIMLDGDVAANLAKQISALQQFQDLLTRTMTAWQEITDQDGETIQDSYDSDIIGRVVFAVVE